MKFEYEQQILEVLRDIREGQNKIIEGLAAQRALAESQILATRKQIDESVGLQREALRRQRVVGRIAVPSIVLCVAAIVYIVWRYL
jgi:hypothetical protein